MCSMAGIWVHSQLTLSIDANVKASASFHDQVVALNGWTSDFKACADLWIATNAWISRASRHVSFYKAAGTLGGRSLCSRSEFIPPCLLEGIALKANTSQGRTSQRQWEGEVEEAIPRRSSRRIPPSRCLV